MNTSIRLMLLDCLFAAPRYAQVDSLEGRLAEVDGRDRVAVLAAPVEAPWSNDPVQAITYGREALALLRAYPDAALKATVWFYKGSAHYVVSEYDSARIHAERLQEIGVVLAFSLFPIGSCLFPLSPSPKRTSLLISARAFVLGEEPGQIAEAGRRRAAFYVLRADFKGDAPLLHQHAVGVPQAVFRIVDMRGFRRDPVEFDDLEVDPVFKVFERRRPDVVPAKVEAGDALADAVDGGFERRGVDDVSIQKNSPPAMCAQRDELNLFAGGGDVEDAILVLRQVEARHRYSAVVVDDEAFQRP